MSDLFYQMQFAPITVSAIGDAPIVPAVSGKRIRVMNYKLNGSGSAPGVVWKSNTTAISGPIYVCGMTPPAESILGLMQTAVNQPLVLSVPVMESATATIGGHVGYILID